MDASLLRQAWVGFYWEPQKNEDLVINLRSSTGGIQCLCHGVWPLPNSFCHVFYFQFLTGHCYPSRRCIPNDRRFFIHIPIQCVLVCCHFCDGRPILTSICGDVKSVCGCFSQGLFFGGLKSKKEREKKVWLKYRK